MIKKERVILFFWESHYAGCNVDKLFVCLSVCLASVTGRLLLKDASIIPGNYPGSLAS